MRRQPLLRSAIVLSLVLVPAGLAFGNSDAAMLWQTQPESNPKTNL